MQNNPGQDNLDQDEPSRINLVRINKQKITSFAWAKSKQTSFNLKLCYLKNVSIQYVTLLLKNIYIFLDHHL
jgi:hypothetical protein